MSLVERLAAREALAAGCLDDVLGEGADLRLLTFEMGLTFLCTQVIEYSRIGFSWHENAFTTTFYGLTGLHGAHVQ